MYLRFGLVQPVLTTSSRTVSQCNENLQNRITIYKIPYQDPFAKLNSVTCFLESMFALSSQRKVSFHFVVLRNLQLFNHDTTEIVLADLQLVKQRYMFLFGTNHYLLVVTLFSCRLFKVVCIQTIHKRVNTTFWQIIKKKTMLSDVLKYIGVALYNRLSFQSSEDDREIKHKNLWNIVAGETYSVTEGRDLNS